jgi:hypothetical protein
MIKPHASNATASAEEIPPAPTPCLWNGCRLLLWHLGDHARASRDERYTHRLELREAGRVVHWNVKAKDTRREIGRIEPGQHAEIAPGRWIRVFGVCDEVAVDRVFWLGDEAAYDGFNLTYIGRIEAIGTSTITVRNGSARRLSIYDFVFWNKRFDVSTIRANNRATCI